MKSVSIRVAAVVFICASLASCERTDPEAPANAGDSAPSVEFARTFVDITADSGIRFRHVTGAYGDKLMPETLGSGAAFLDYDGDGVLDIFFVNGSRWPHSSTGADGRCALYRGLGGGRFEDVSSAAGANVRIYGMGCAVADYEGDGDPDIYITAVGANVLLRNDGGVFADATSDAGVAGGRWIDADGNPHWEWSTAAAWTDIDNDGDLDLFVTNYVEWSPELEIFTTLDGTAKAFTTPDRYRGLPCRLFRNLGGGSFEDVSDAVGLSGILGKSLGVALWDFDDDGFRDIVVANDTQPNFLFFNRGGERLEERGLVGGIAYDESGRARAGMGVDVADYGNDGIPGVAIGNFSREPMSLYRWTEDGAFLPSASASGLAAATFLPLAFAVAFHDLDLDGHLDLIVVNGHIEPDITRIDAQQSHAQRTQVFAGTGDGRFREVTSDAGAPFRRLRVGRGLAAGDIDGDGDLDLLVTTNDGPPTLLRNDAKTDRGHHYLRVSLRDSGANPGALGAAVTVFAGGQRQTRRVRTGSSYLSQSETVLTFGLGAATSVEELTVRWPDGAVTRHEVGEIDRSIVLERP